MSRIKWSLGLWIVALLAGVAALRAQEEMPVTLDEEYARLAERIPGFGGLYLDERGTTHVYLQDLSRSREVQDLGERVEVHQGEYDFRDLFAWKDEVRPLLSREEMVSLDIDEERNRLVLGTEAGAVAALRAELPVLLRGTRVPPEAVIVEAEERPVPMEKLTDRIRPVPGGVRIRSSAPSGCTLGVNATRNLFDRGFVTNSHCTQTWGKVEGTIFYQRSIISSDQIGVETVDPPYFTTSPCPVGRKCRYSDSAFVEYDDPNDSEGGNIANPILCGLGGGELTVSSVLPRLPITSASVTNPPSGTILYKVGATTGCTFGSLKETCKDYLVSIKVNGTYVSTNIMRLCQNRVAAVVDKGDSGSPVFTQKNNKATIRGLLWGGAASDGASSYFLYSPWGFVASDLGPLMVDAP